MQRKVFLNDKLVDSDKACISAADRGLLYGAGLFETMLAYNKVVFALDDHIDRLFLSARRLKIKNTCTRKSATEAIYKTLKANKLIDARIRLTLTAGVKMKNKTIPTLLITTEKLKPYPKKYYQNGATALLCPFEQNTTEPTCGHKTTSYFSRITALDMAKGKNAVESIWFTNDGRLAEGCITNVFLVKKSTLLTPPLATPVLAGVARKTVCKIAMGNSIKLVEKKLYKDDLLKADEVFITNVIMKVMPIIRIEQKKTGNGKPGPVTRKLQKLYNEFVKLNCGQKK